MSHSDERSRSEEISPTKDTPRGRPVHDWSDIYSLKVLKNEKYRFVKEQLVVDFELLNWNPSYPQNILIKILFVAGIVDEYGHKYRIGALWKSNMILSLSSLRQLEARSGRSFKAERIKSTRSSKCLQSSLGNMILCLGKHVDRNLQSKIKKYCGTTSQSTNNSTGDNPVCQT